MGTNRAVSPEVSALLFAPTVQSLLGSLPRLCSGPPPPFFERSNTLETPLFKHSNTPYLLISEKRTHLRSISVNIRVSERGRVGLNEPILDGPI